MMGLGAILKGRREERVEGRKERSSKGETCIGGALVDSTISLSLGWTTEGGAGQLVPSQVSNNALLMSGCASVELLFLLTYMNLVHNFIIYITIAS